MSPTYDRIKMSRILTKILSVCGLWPLTHSPRWYRFSRIYGYCLQCSLTFTYTMLMWVEIFLSNDLKHTTDVMYVVLTETALMAKITNMWYYSRMAVEMFRSLEQDAVLALRTKEEEQMWTRAQRNFGIVFYIFFTISFGVICSKTVSVIFMAGYELPYYFWMPFDWHKPPNYWYAFCYSFISMPLTVVTNIPLDMLLCYMMFHLTLCFKLLGQRMQQVGRGCKKEEAVRLELFRIVVMHQYIRRLCRKCEMIVSIPVLAQALLSAFVLCLSIYRLQKSSISDNPGDFISMLQYAIALTIQIFLPCYYANELTVSSQRLSNYLYSSNWIELSARHRRFIYIYMTYMHKPIIFRAGGFFEIGLPIFTKTMNNAYSLLTILLNKGN